MLLPPDAQLFPEPSTGESATAPPAHPCFSALQAVCAVAVNPLRQAIRAVYRRDERTCVAALRAEKTAQDAGIDTATTDLAAGTLATGLVAALRDQRQHSGSVDALTQEFSLSCEEGVALMCLAEALLRIPDSATADRLIADKIGNNDWQRHIGESPSLFVNAATWGLLITGKLVAKRSEQERGYVLKRVLAKAGAPLVRQAVDLAMRMLGNQFVIGQSIEAALANSSACIARGYRYSYDMLGEAAVTGDDAARYTDAYRHAIETIGMAAQDSSIHDRPGISVKLSALHPRYSRLQRARVMSELLPRLKSLVLLARAHAVGINIDAEEADRLELSLDLLEALAFDPDLASFDGIGFVVQTYQKRSMQVIDFLADLARRSQRRLMVRLVKGAYWDTEIKRAQVDGLPDYPVYTRKVHTDMSYLVCARKLLASAHLLYPQFATHNAQTLAAVHTWARQAGVANYEFQCLHGMGEALYDQVLREPSLAARCRIYAPVGPHRTLLAYLVRRLLENGANSSFVNRLVDPAVPIAALVADPFTTTPGSEDGPHPAIILPDALFGSRRNSRGIDLNDDAVLAKLSQQLQAFGKHLWRAAPLLGTPRSYTQPLTDTPTPARSIRNPACRNDLVGSVVQADAADLAAALASATHAAVAWQATPADDRARILEHAANLFDDARVELIALLVRGAGKTLPDAMGEIREAIDFLRFYAAQGRAAGAIPALGVVVCISPWNFPLAIFTGQVGAALAAGNSVLAKPAEQTPLVAYRAAQLLHLAGVPRAVLQLLPGAGAAIGGGALADTRVHGVLFTGSTGVAQTINRVLACRAANEEREVPLIAETGGQNAMIVDSSALPEQVVQDVLTSAFNSAGQRCSALRVLCLQTEIADATLQMLRGAMAERGIGRPDCLAHDIGPVIDAAARERLVLYIAAMREAGATVFEMPVDASVRAALAAGTFVLPTVIEITDLAQLHGEVFGPVLHVLRYQRAALPALVAAINATGYGLTLGIHSRIDETIAFVTGAVRVGNLYVNRSMIGAVVGSQPFGGARLSGTGPKAGGPLYLSRLQRGGVSMRQTSADAALPALPAAPFFPSWRAWRKRLADTGSFDLPVSVGIHSGAAMQVALPGPTGESNLLSLRPRGNVLCVAASAAALLHQLDATFETGNRAVILTAHACFLPDDLPAAARCWLRVCSLQELTDESASLPIDAALVENDQRAGWHERLAARQGLLVPVIITHPDAGIDLTRLACEYAVSTDLTAAGGNARLMSLDAQH